MQMVNYSSVASSSHNQGGTAQWQAPEIYQGKPNSFAADIYAYSCVCYEMKPISYS
ncbi:hypothetical protein C8J56DRAFT_785667 [Mycena floridula]|nr:hypothetical protein C8J56DRAFT_785667 [Mycena floridula]